MAMKNEHLDENFLYQCIAGSISKPLTRIGHWEISTITISNDTIYQQIEEAWRQSFLSQLPQDEQDHWTANSPAFVVSNSFPFVDGKLSKVLPKPESQDSKGKLAYAFLHPEDPSFYIKVFKPLSPPIQKHGAGKHKPVTTKLYKQNEHNRVITIQLILYWAVLTQLK